MMYTSTCKIVCVCAMAWEWLPFVDHVFTINRQLKLAKNSVDTSASNQVNIIILHSICLWSKSFSQHNWQSIRAHNSLNNMRIYISIYMYYFINIYIYTIIFYLWLGLSDKTVVKCHCKYLTTQSTTRIGTYKLNKKRKTYLLPKYNYM